MGQVKEINIKNQTYYFFNDMINIKNFHSKLLKINKKAYKDIDIYYIIKIKKFGDCENIHIVNSFYLIIHSTTGHFKEKNGEKYLILNSTDKYEEVWSGIRSETKIINGGKELFYEKNYAGIRFNTDDDLPLNKPLNFPTLTIIMESIFEESGKFYPQICLDECLYEL